MDTITSAQNPLVKRIRRLGQRKARREEGAFFIEGPRSFLAAVDAEAVIETAVVAPELLRSQPCYAALDHLRAQGVPVATLSGELFTRLAARERPAGIGAIVATRSTTLDGLLATDRAAAGLYVALVDAADPGNVGTVLRTLDAAGGSGLILIGQSTDPYHPTAVKASMGSLFAVPLCEVDVPAAALRWARHGGLQVVATSAHAQKPLWEAPLRRPLLLLMGSEREGLDPAALAAADLAVTIPMVGTATSLNLAVATSLLLYELVRRERSPRP